MSLARTPAERLIDDPDALPALLVAALELENATQVYPGLRPRSVATAVDVALFDAGWKATGRGSGHVHGEQAIDVVIRLRQLGGSDGAGSAQRQTLDRLMRAAFRALDGQRPFQPDPVAVPTSPSKFPDLRTARAEILPLRQDDLTADQAIGVVRARFSFNGTGLAAAVEGA